MKMLYEIRRTTTTTRESVAFPYIIEDGILSSLPMMVAVQVSLAASYFLGLPRALTTHQVTEKKKKLPIKLCQKDKKGTKRKVYLYEISPNIFYVLG